MKKELDPLNMLQNGIMSGLKEIGNRFGAGEYYLVDKAREVNEDIIGLSAFLVTTIPFCSEVINYLKDLNIRDQFKVIIGGTETSQAAADAMGADGWLPNAMGY